MTTYTTDQFFAITYYKRGSHMKWLHDEIYTEERDARIVANRMENQLDKATRRPLYDCVDVERLDYVLDAMQVQLNP